MIRNVPTEWIYDTLNGGMALLLGGQESASLLGYNHHYQINRYQAFEKGGHVQDEGLCWKSRTLPRG